MDLEANKAVVRRFTDELWSRGDLNVADEIIHAETENTRGGSMWADGPASVKAWVTEQRGTLEGFQREALEMVAEGDLVVLYSKISGVFPPTGGNVELFGVACFRFRDGKMVGEPWSHWDLLKRPMSQVATEHYLRENAAADA